MAQPKGDHFGSHPGLQQVLRSAVAERARGRCADPSARVFVPMASSRHGWPKGSTVRNPKQLNPPSGAML
jgi:hypothetical protein